METKSVLQEYELRIQAVLRGAFDEARAILGEEQFEHDLSVSHYMPLLRAKTIADESGKSVPYTDKVLSEVSKGEPPAILTAYYDCVKEMVNGFVPAGINSGKVAQLRLAANK